MIFKDALSHMKKGHALALPEWGGYWTWSAERKTIDMHCKDGSIVDMRDSPDMGFTLSHTARQDWQVLDDREETEHHKALRQKGGA